MILIKQIKFKGITFRNFDIKDFKKIIERKGLFLFPSGPGLASIETEKNYFEALKAANYNFVKIFKKDKSK